MDFDLNNLYPFIFIKKISQHQIYEGMLYHALQDHNDTLYIFICEEDSTSLKCSFMFDL